MNKPTLYIFRNLSVLLLAISSHSIFAADIVTAVGNSEPEPISENGGFFEIGLEATASRVARIHSLDETQGDSQGSIGIDISGGYRYKRLFVEATGGGFDGLNLGASLWQNNKWTVDFLAANIAGNIKIESDEPAAPITELEKNQALIDRDTLYIAAGTRITRYFDNNRIAQILVASDWHRDNGMFASARLGQQWQVGNWSWTGFLGARYHSRKFNNYLYGVTANEASDRFPEFSANSAVALEAEIGTSYPLTRKLVFSSRLRYRAYPDEIANSPLLDGDDDVFFKNSIKYVF